MQQPKHLKTMVKNALIAAAVVSLLGAGVALAANGGFNQYGYNYGARIFNGTYNQWCQKAYSTSSSACDGILGVYANDKVVMKWNAQWDNCNNDGNVDSKYCLGAWLDNEFNGKFPGGSGESWHYKIIWVGPSEQSSQYWISGGEAIWGNYEIIMDQGEDPNVGLGHMWFAHTTPNGYGSVSGN